MLRKTFVTGVSLSLLLGLTAPMHGEETRVVNVKITVDKEPQDKPIGKKPFTGIRPAVDVAILLDTSNSMDGLISQAKTQLWTIVRQFAEAEKNGRTPSLRVALFEYGNSGLPASEGYIRQVVQLTDDLDLLSEKLFGLSTNGGDEYCGQVINETIKRLDWSKEPNSYKAIFIAGNEPFTQGPVDFRKSCKRAIEEGVVVNTIHCGNYKAGVRGKWQEGAQLAEGEYFNIDQDRAVVHIKCPQDKIIIQLNAQLNDTYLWYGRADVRRRYAENQLAQDSNASGVSAGALLGRVVTKAGRAYRNKNRDLVDTLAENPDGLKDIDEQDLPEKLQEMKPTERKALIDKMAAQRKVIQAKIAKLNAEREAYLAKQRKLAANENDGDTLGDAVVTAVRKQLEKKGFKTAK